MKAFTVANQHTDRLKCLVSLAYHNGKLLWRNVFLSKLLYNNKCTFGWEKEYDISGCYFNVIFSILTNKHYSTVYSIVL